MADLHTLLERAAEGYEPPPDEYRRTLDRAARTHRRRRIGTAVLALAIAAVGLSAAALAFRGAARTERPASRTPAGTGTSPRATDSVWIGRLGLGWLMVERTIKPISSKAIIGASTVRVMRLKRVLNFSLVSL